jgi:drug/metabolite transporter (DMT)-like permease
MSRAVSALLLGAACIALSPIFVRLSETGPTATAFWRVALAVPVLWLFWLMKRNPGTGQPGAWPLLLAAGVAFAGDLGFWHTSIKLTSVANSTLLANLASIFVTLAAWIFLRQKPSPLFLAGLATALAGVALLVKTSVEFSATGLAGDALGVLTAMFYAGYIFAVKELRDRGETTLYVMAMTSTVTAVLLLPAAFASGEIMVPSTTRAWSVLLGLALVSHGLGQGLIAYALAHLPASFSSVSLLFQPVMAAVLAWALLSEALAPLQIVGGLVVLLGIYLARKGST